MIWTRTRDKYGRSVHELRTDQMRTQGVAVKLPRQTAHLFPAPYFTNNWQTADRDDAIRYHATLKLAKAHLEAELA